MLQLDYNYKTWTIKQLFLQLATLVLVVLGCWWLANYFVGGKK